MAYFKVVGEWLGGLKLTLNVWASTAEKAEKKFVDSVPKLGFSGYPPQPITVKAVALAPAHWPSGDYVDNLHVVRQIMMENFNVYLHVVSKIGVEAALDRAYEPQEWVQARFQLEDDSIGMDENQWVRDVLSS